MPHPARRALIVVDVQHEYVDGALPIAHPPLTTSLPAIGRAIAAARAAGVPVVVVRHEDEPGSPVFAVDSPTARLAEPAASTPADVEIVKQAVSAFAGTPLADRLDAMDVDTIALTGFMTHFCIESTARDGADRGLAVEVLADATGTLAIAGVDAVALHETSLAVLRAGFASVADTDGWIAAVRSGDALPAPDLMANVRPAG